MSSQVYVSGCKHTSKKRVLLKQYFHCNKYYLNATWLAQNYLGAISLQSMCTTNPFKLTKHSKNWLLMACFIIFSMTKIINEL